MPDSDVPASITGEPNCGCKFVAEVNNGPLEIEFASFPVPVTAFCHAASVVKSVVVGFRAVMVENAAFAPLVKKSLKSEVKLLKFADPATP